MKKRILLFSAAIALISSMLQSYNAGPAHVIGYNRTGADGGVANCSNGGCHSGGNYQVAIYGIDFSKLNGDPAPTWDAGQTYFVNLNAQTDTSAHKFGLQVSSSNKVNNQPAGIFDAVNPATHDTIINGYSIVEHNYTLSIQNQQALMNMKWTAPSDTTIDTVIFHCTINLVDGNSATSGDNSFHFTQKYGRFKIVNSVAKLNADIKISAYPNPVTDKLNLSIDNAENGAYTISVFDVQGKVVATKNADVHQSYHISLDASAWAAGMYHVQLKKGNAQKTIAVVKQ
jgi:hypothetical protein